MYIGFHNCRCFLFSLPNFLTHFTSLPHDNDRPNKFYTVFIDSGMQAINAKTNQDRIGK